MPVPVYKKYKDDAARVALYQNRVFSAEKYQEEWSPLAEEMIQRYAMRHEGRFTPKGHRIRSTTALGVLDSMFSNLVAVDVSALIENLGEKGTPLQAKIAEKVVQNDWEKNKGKRKSDKAIKNGALCGIGFNKVFYDYVEVERDAERAPEDIEADVDRLFDEAEVNGVEPPTPDQIGELIPLTEVVSEAVRNTARIEYVPWKEVLWDYNAQDWEEVRWVAHVMRMTRAELLADPDIVDFAGKKAILDLPADVVLDDKYRVDASGDTRQASYDDELITIVQMWDLEAADVVMFPRASVQIILKKSDNCFAFNDDLEDRNPFCPVILRWDTENVRGISEMEVLRHLVDEEEVYRSNLATYIERMKTKFFYPEGAIGPKGDKALESAEWMVGVPLEDGATGNEVQIAQMPQMPSEAFGMLDRIKTEAREATGVNEFMRGLMANKRTTATEVNAVDNHSLGRHSEKLNALEHFYTSIFKRLLWIAQRYYDDERVVRIAGIDPTDIEAGAEETIWDWSVDDISSEMHLRVHLVPKEPLTQQSKREMAMWALEVFPLVEGVDNREVVRWAAEEVGMDPRVVARFIKTQAEMQVEEMANRQSQAAEVMTADGVTPDPSMVPGPLSAEELAAAANAGELPQDLPTQ